MEKFSLPSSKLIFYSKGSELVSTWIKSSHSPTPIKAMALSGEGERRGMSCPAMVPNWAYKGNSHLLL